MENSSSKEQKIANFDPNGVGSTGGNLFGLPFDYSESEVVIFPVPWEVTVSYSDGTAAAPEAILAASPQLDLYDPMLPNAWQHGIFMQPIDKKWANNSQQYRQKAKAYIETLEKGMSAADSKNVAEMKKSAGVINRACAKMVNWVRQQTTQLLEDGKIVGLLGGDHSTPLGFMQALATRHGSFGILQIDAHADLRPTYEGFTYSHASIMYNALGIEAVRKIVSVGVRDVCEAEVRLAEQSEGRVKAYYDWKIKQTVHIERTQSWAKYCRKIVKQLPKKVYISFDIDGLDPKLCPRTGTPVAGGLSLHEAFYLLDEVVRSGRYIVGFDLVEVVPTPDSEWSANVAARLLYKMANCAIKSRPTTK